MARAFTVALLLFSVSCGGGDDAGSGNAGGTGGAGGGGGSAAGGSGGSGGAAGAPILNCEGLAGSSATGATFHVAIDGSATGDGSSSAPWDLQTALLHPASVQPGDTIVLHGGVYAGSYYSKLVGADVAPITVRSAPGEWAVIDSAGSDTPTFEAYKESTVFRDLEFRNSDPDRTVSRPSGIYVEGKFLAFINVFVHDVGTGIIGNSASADNEEFSPELLVYGSLFYNNGMELDGTGHGHHVYLQNRDGTKHIVDNVLFDSFGFGIHAYSDTDTYYAQGYEIRGNVFFQAGVATMGESKLYDDCMVGHNGTHPVSRLELRENYGYATNPGERDVRLGWNAPNEDVKLTDNYIVGLTIFQPSWNSVEMSGNTFYGELQGEDPANHPDNTYLSARPTGAKVVMRPNQYQPGRAHVIVYNWDLADSVTFDPGSFLPNGAVFELSNAQDPFAAPVLSGTYDGTPLELPMSGLEPVQPIGYAGAITDAEKTGKEFNVFLLTSGCP